MKFFILLLVAVSPIPSSALAGNPVQKVLELLSGLQAKIVKEGEEAQKVYAEFAEWCEDESKNYQFSIKTAKSEIEELQATIAKAAATIGANAAAIDELAGAISTDEADLKAATEIRDREEADFSAEDAELGDAVDTLGRAINVLERHAALVQEKHAVSLAQALTVLVEASAFSSKDAEHLTSFVQSQSDSDDSDMGAPDPEAYKGHSGGIVEVLEGLLEKAEEQLKELRSKEMNSKHNFELLEQSLKDSIKTQNKELGKAKASSAAAAETKATSEGDLAMTEKGLSEDTQALGELHQSCMTKSTDFEAATKSRAEELKALAAAKKIIAESTGGAEAVVYGAASFLQVSRLATGADLANFEAVRYVRSLARTQHSDALAQLASRMNVAMRYGASSGGDPFEKVKALIMDMVERLSREAEEDATQKAYCDKEMAETEQKKNELNADIEKLSTKIDQMTARSAKLKEEVAALQKELGDLAKSQAEMDKIRQDEKAQYVSDKADSEEGLEGVQMALKILREYYAQEDKGHGAAEGAASGIIGMLEVVESDFSKALADMNTSEDAAQSEYDRQTKQNQITKVTKEQDVKYKTKEAAGLDKAIAEASSDRVGAQTELDAVLEYDTQIKATCIAKPETYAERARRREAEIAGLKEALQILEGEAVLLQKGSRKVTGKAHGLRGALQPSV